MSIPGPFHLMNSIGTTNRRALTTAACVVQENLEEGFARPCASPSTSVAGPLASSITHTLARQY
ncbi:hypothetical protein BC936DRAFT_149218 [Jimgerdemannia flammicorona]|uniref:Uncharacterized protein n=1 Tax=Jimgerdemannia flammicorona TaxID=994334 RepID=A0A433D1A1_9FUNG|nr:hypothetical protein BC936DRAFT_149218 [Jimgerdemannia flammicorona]